jgi:BirA family biotin operon repressor/biotin-[acetyl-CoA-carboxylase] ligase
MQFQIQSFKELSSTNSLALDYAAKGASEGLVIVADYQTNGRGKPGRKWVSPRGKNLLFSILLRPPISPSKAPSITQIACRSVAKVLKCQYEIPCTFKRPNDVLVKGKKVCGILAESSSRSNGDLEAVVVGIGLNVNAGLEELVPEATSLKELTAREYSREKLLRKILAQLKLDLKGLYGHSA